MDVTKREQEIFKSMQAYCDGAVRAHIVNQIITQEQTMFENLENTIRKLEIKIGQLTTAKAELLAFIKIERDTYAAQLELLKERIEIYNEVINEWK